MKLRVIYAKRKYKGKTYTTALVVTSYRDAAGVSRHKTVINLSALPSFLVSLIEKALKLGDVDILHQYGLIADFKYLTSLVIGPAYVVFQLLKELGIIAILKTFLTKTQVTIICALIIERVTHGKPLSVSALCRRFTKEASFHLLGGSQSPELKTWYRSLGALEKNREAILKELFKKHQPAGELYLYDITSTFFYSDSCPISENGYSRDNRPDREQIIIGVVTSYEGYPIKH